MKAMPGAVRAVEIPKDHGAGVRVLGVPSVVDRVAQTAVAIILEERVEPIFHRDSYGYRPGRSALDALEITRGRCWKQDWIVDLARVSRPVLREPGGAIPPGHSPEGRVHHESGIA